MSEYLDMDVIDELLSLTGDGDPELLLDLIDMFLEDAPNKIASITSGLEGSDLEKIVAASHSLKGSSGNLGVRLVHEDSDALQTASRQGDMEEVSRLVPLLEEHFSVAVGALEDLRSRLS